MGRAGAGVAAPCADGSAMFFNPAGLAGLTGGHVTIGVTLLDVQGGCERCGGMGFVGRTPVYEVLMVTPAIRELMRQRLWARPNGPEQN